MSTRPSRASAKRDRSSTRTLCQPMVSGLVKLIVPLSSRSRCPNVLASLHSNNTSSPYTCRLNYTIRLWSISLCRPIYVPFDSFVSTCSLSLSFCFSPLNISLRSINVDSRFFLISLYFFFRPAFLSLSLCPCSYPVADHTNNYASNICPHSVAFQTSDSVNIPPIRQSHHVQKLSRTHIC